MEHRIVAASAFDPIETPLGGCISLTPTAGISSLVGAQLTLSMADPADGRHAFIGINHANAADLIAMLQAWLDLETGP